MPAQKLRVAFLWHQHQPDYKFGDRFVLPWVRLHALKDYLDITVTALERFPKLRQTINVVPSLLLQLNDYTLNNATDDALSLSAIPAETLSDDEKSRIIRSFFTCNAAQMIDPYPRYQELFHRIGRDARNAETNARVVALWSAQDWRDLQVWYNLTWIGPYSRLREPFAGLLDKGRGFTEQDKAALLAASAGIVASVIPAYRRLMDSGQIELSVTPMYHPILPLLCNTESAREAMPEARLPDPPIRLREDAAWHIGEAIARFREYFGAMPDGMWPSEGAVSTESVRLMANAGINWTATDEGILQNTLGEQYRNHDKFFPYTLRTPAGPLWMVFRDHGLSDAIGFEYPGWDPGDAARDFHSRLTSIRNHLINELGEDALQSALAPVILDGENCWEYYADNGRPFLEALYTLLSDSDEIESVSIGQALKDRQPDPRRTLDRIFAGSWIHSNFGIWIGDKEDIIAWGYLVRARQALMNAKPRLTQDLFDEAMRHIYIAQGSDWFWWYGPQNISMDNMEFDALFRGHLMIVHEIIGEPVPPELLSPIQGEHVTERNEKSIGAMHRAK